MSNRIVTNTFSYKLTLGNTIDNEAKDSLELEQRDKKSITIGEKSYKIALNGVKFNRKIYQPGEIEAEILINEDLTGKDKIFATEVPTSSETKSLFMMRQVTLQVIQKDDDGNQVNTENPDDNKIAINYYVHELNPQLLKQASGGLTLAVKLTAFSMDKLMTLDKYSKVYVAKKLGSGILEQESKAFGCMIKNTQSSNQTSWSKQNYVETNRDHLRHLKYEQQVNVKVKGVTVPVTISSEFIHPYLIQYNETFYDFMARTANRCGEFLYFEKGKLWLGLEETTTPLDISGFATITGQQFSASPLTIGEYARDSMKEGINEPQETNYTRIKKNAAGFPEDAFPLEPAYNAELTADEYYFPLYADKFDSNNREWGYAHNVQEGLASYAFMTLKNLASSNTDPVGFITDAAFEKIKLASRTTTIPAKKITSKNTSLPSQATACRLCPSAPSRLKVGLRCAISPMCVVTRRPSSGRPSASTWVHPTSRSVSARLSRSAVWSRPSSSFRSGKSLTRSGIATMRSMAATAPTATTTSSR